MGMDQFGITEFRPGDEITSEKLNAIIQAAVREQVGGLSLSDPQGTIFRNPLPGGSGSGAQVIRFTVTAAGAYLYGDDFGECDEIHVTARVTDVLCSGSGVEVGDEINVWDPPGCNFNIPAELLIGASGWAIRMTSSLSGYACGDSPDDSTGCRWVVLNLCCAEEVYGG